MLAGLVHLSSMYTLMPDRQSCADSVASLVVSVGVGAFASAQVPGRLPPNSRRIDFGIFCIAAAGAVFFSDLGGPACILAVCLGYVALFQDGPGLRFFAARFRPAVLAISIAAAMLAVIFLGVFGPHAQCNAAATAEQLGTWSGVIWGGIRLLPWVPWAVLAIVAGWRQGDYAAPFGRLLIAWLVGPWTLWAAGAMPARLAFAAFSPAVAITAAVGLREAFCKSVGWAKRSAGPP
jgi:hypothetical protein